jgi:2-polyprenyl-3-methyl-5-hydroxy-6-metoxy-1,4-benzoquinol methylase
MDLGVTDLLGLDGDYVDRKMLLIPEANFRPTDLRRRITADRRFDLAISMEVAEHLPYHRSETFVRDLVALSDVVL